MWPGPYGEWGSRKYLVASLDQSLKRMGLDYVDIFYSHRPDPETPLDETMTALDYIVRSGRALYAGISSYSAEMTKQASQILKSLGTPCLIHQPYYNMFGRWIEDGLMSVLDEEGIGCIAFSPLAQGLLTDKYLSGIPGDSRAQARVPGRSFVIGLAVREFQLGSARAPEHGGDHHPGSGALERQSLRADSLGHDLLQSQGRRIPGAGGG